MPTENVPPQNIEAEMAILGGAFVDFSSIDKALEIITADDFYREAHRLIFNAMLELYDKNEPCDLVTMMTLLKAQGHLDAVGGAPYLITLIDYVPSAASVANYAKMVADKALERRLLQQATETIGMLHSGQSAVEVMDKLETGLARLTTPGQGEPVGAMALVKESAMRLRQRHASKDKLQGMSWGIEGLDEATNGMQRGDLIVIAGRPSMGKSALAGNVLDATCSAGLTGLMNSLEMPRVDVTDRIIAGHGSIKFHHLRNGKLTDVEWAKNASACNDISQWKLFIDDTPGIGLREIKSKAKRQKRQGLDLLVIDYLQLLRMSAIENRSRAIGEVTSGLKLLARELDMAVILLSQLNRGVDSRPDKRPTMSDLRESGEIEQDADVILFPYRPAAYCPKCKDRVNDGSHNLQEHQAQSEIIIGKQRNGESNISIPTAWFGAFQRFECLGSQIKLTP